MADPSPPVDLARVLRLLRLTLGFNVLLIVVNAVMFYALVVLVVQDPGTVDGIDPFNEEGDDPDAKVKADPQQEMREFFDRTTDLLDRAARKAGANPADVLPTQDEVNAAVETKTIHSDESQAVMQKLREGFDYYNIAWPAVVPER